MSMNGLLRACRYATFRGLRVLGVTLLLSVGFVFYFMFIGSQTFTVDNALAQFPYMLLFVGSLMIATYGMMDVAIYMQLTMSYGCTRKNAALSTIYMNLMEILVIEVILALYLRLVPVGEISAKAPWLCGAALMVYLFGSGYAMIGGILIHRFGKVVYTIVLLLLIAAGSVLGFIGGFFEGTDIIVERAMTWPTALLGVASAAWFVLASLILWLFTRRMEVRV
jgi:hypothetical protein